MIRNHYQNKKYINKKDDHQPQINSSILNDRSNNHQQFSIINASNTQLREIIQKLILKSRSLISSLENTLKQLEQVRNQKDFWKNHYITFKNSCEKYIQSHGIAPFQYISELQRTIKDWSYKKDDIALGSSYRSVSANNFKSFSLANSRNIMASKPRIDNTMLLSEQSKQIMNQPNILKGQQSINTQANSQSKTLQNNEILNIKQGIREQQNNDSLNNNRVIIDRQFRGIKLGGSNKKKGSPLQVQNKKKRQVYKRKDSIQTKRIQLFSFTNHNSRYGQIRLNSLQKSEM